MRFAVFVLATVCMAPTMQAQAGLTTLADLRDNSRPLLIFAARPDDPQLEIQLRTLQEHAADAHDRQIVPVALVYANPSVTDTKFTAAEAETVRRRFAVPPDQFAVILIGKDGGEKLRSNKPLSIAKLDETIDAMPMRRDEVKTSTKHTR